VDAALCRKEIEMFVLLVLVIGLVVFDLLAVLYGVDSRNMKAPELRSDWK
jgi:hypothetical protein